MHFRMAQLYKCRSCVSGGIDIGSTYRIERTLSTECFALLPYETLTVLFIIAFRLWLLLLRAATKLILEKKKLWAVHLRCDLGWISFTSFATYTYFIDIQFEFIYLFIWWCLLIGICVYGAAGVFIHLLWFVFGSNIHCDAGSWAHRPIAIGRDFFVLVDIADIDARCTILRKSKI